MNIASSIFNQYYKTGGKMVGMASGARGLMPKSAGGRAAMKLGAVGTGILAAGYAGVNAYANDRDASQVNLWGATALGGYGGAAAVLNNRHKQGQNLFTRPGSVNNHLFPGGGDQGIG